MHGSLSRYEKPQRSVKCLASSSAITSANPAITSGQSRKGPAFTSSKRLSPLLAPTNLRAIYWRSSTRMSGSCSRPELSPPSLSDERLRYLLQRRTTPLRYRSAHSAQSSPGQNPPELARVIAYPVLDDLQFAYHG